MIDETPIRTRYGAVRPSLDERGRRLCAAAEAKSAGYGGIAAAARADEGRSKYDRTWSEGFAGPESLTGKVRRKGAGRRLVTATDPTLLADLRQLLEPATMGDPTRLLRWVSKSHESWRRRFARWVTKVSSSTIPKLLEALNYCRHFNRKTKEGSSHPDRNAQFEYLNAKARAFQAADQPVISVDTKKKELIGAFKNGAATMDLRASRSRSHPRFREPGTRQGRPVWVYDIGANLGYVQPWNRS